MTNSVSIACQNLQSYFLMYFVVMVVANSNIFSVFLASEVESGEELQCSADAIHQAYTNTDP